MERRARLEVLVLVLARAALVLVGQEACKLFVQLVVARLISGDGVKRRRRASQLFALFRAPEEHVDEATHVRLALDPRIGLSLAGDARPDASVAAAAAGHRAVVYYRPHDNHPHTTHTIWSW